MVRALLTYPLILAVAVGPMLCCCTVGRLVAAPVPAHPTASVVPTSTSVPTHACCPRNGQDPAETADGVSNPTQGQHDPCQPGCPCPCQGGSVKVEAAQTAAESVDVAELLRIASFDPALPDLVFGWKALSDAGDRGYGHGPPGRSCFPSTADLLFSHHKLRC